MIWHRNLTQQKRRSGRFLCHLKETASTAQFLGMSVWYSEKEVYHTGKYRLIPFGCSSGISMPDRQPLAL